VLANPASFDVALTTYEMVQSQQLGLSLCRTIFWRYLVLDEGHKIKNEHTNVAHTMRQVRSARARPDCAACIFVSLLGTAGGRSDPLVRSLTGRARAAQPAERAAADRHAAAEQPARALRAA
jgi:hypothetical protein